MLEEKAVVRITSAVTALALLLAVSVSPVSAARPGPPHPAFYVDGLLYRTIGTPTDLSRTGAPASSFDTLYALGSGLLDVASSAPGDTDYSGGRWMRFPVTWNVAPYQPTSEEDLLAAAAAGDLTVASSPDALFVCPVIR
jgi:hypothetical protein